MLDIMMPLTQNSVSSPLAFIAAFEDPQISWPRSKDDREAWRKTASALRPKMKATIRFTRARLALLKEDSELYYTLCEAKATAATIHRLALQMGWATGNKFMQKADALRTQCDNLKGSLKQIFMLLDEGELSGRFDRAM
jgi:hypothetical protein